MIQLNIKLVIQLDFINVNIYLQSRVVVDIQMKFLK